MTAGEVVTYKLSQGSSPGSPNFHVLRKRHVICRILMVFTRLSDVYGIGLPEEEFQSCLKENGHFNSLIPEFRQYL